MIRAIKRHLPDAEFFGIGGPKMQAEGFDVRWPCELLAVHCYVDALKRYRELSGIRKTLLSQIRRERPAAFIGVDAPDFNLWLGQGEAGGDACDPFRQRRSGPGVAASSALRSR